MTLANSSGSIRAHEEGTVSHIVYTATFLYGYRRLAVLRRALWSRQTSVSSMGLQSVPFCALNVRPRSRTRVHMGHGRQRHPVYTRAARARPD